LAQHPGPPGTARVAITGNAAGEPFANVFWCNLTGGTTATQAELDAWNTSFYTAYATNLASLIVTGVTINTSTATLFQTTETALHSVHTGSNQGTFSDTPVHNNSSCKVISWISNVYWKGGKPRTYVPTVGQTETTDLKTLITTAVTKVAAQGAAFHNAVNALNSGSISQTQHGFVSFKSGGVFRPSPVFFPILGAAAHPRLGSQRGRLGPWRA
jgi:hypothetical protein